jgi:hypothetical protein
MTLRKKAFHEICDQFPVTRAFLTVRAMQRRAHFKRVNRSLIAQLKSSNYYGDNNNKVDESMQADE